jgi:hypothetical protein
MPKLLLFASALALAAIASVRADDVDAAKEKAIQRKIDTWTGFPPSKIIRDIRQRFLAGKIPYAKASNLERETILRRCPQFFECKHFTPFAVESVKGDSIVAEYLKVLPPPEGKVDEFKVRLAKLDTLERAKVARAAAEWKNDRKNLSDFAKDTVRKHPDLFPD